MYLIKLVENSVRTDLVYSLRSSNLDDKYHPTNLSRYIHKDDSDNLGNELDLPIALKKGSINLNSPQKYLDDSFFLKKGGNDNVKKIDSEVFGA